MSGIGARSWTVRDPASRIRAEHFGINKEALICLFDFCREGGLSFLGSGRPQLGAQHPRHIDDKGLRWTPGPPRDLDPARRFHLRRRRRRRRSDLLTLAVASGATSFRGAGKTSTFATAKGSPLRRQISLRKHNEASGYREKHDANRRFFCWPLVANGQRSCGAESKTERFVQFVPHFSRRPSPRTSQSRKSTLSQPILGRPPKAGAPIHTRCRRRESSVSFSPLIRVDAGFQ